MKNMIKINEHKKENFSSIVAGVLCYSLMFMLLLLSLLIFASCYVSAIPVPVGIDGTVFMLDGITEVPYPVAFNITDINISESILGYTGKGSPGRYSVALPWDVGDEISIEVYYGSASSFASSYRNITLGGVMHNFDIMLNVTRPPSFNSTPPTNISAYRLYFYKIDAVSQSTDGSPEDGNVSLSLVKAPSRMMLWNNTLLWIPLNSEAGMYDVLINATDSMNISALQSFTITVLSTGSDDHRLDIPDSYYDTISPSILLELSYDNDLSTIIPPPAGNNGKPNSGRRWSNNVPPTTNKSNFTNVSGSPRDNAPGRNYEPSGKRRFTLADSLPSFLSSPDRIVYKYLHVDPLDNSSDNIGDTITFNVSKSWLDSRELSPEDIVLLSYNKKMEYIIPKLIGRVEKTGDKSIQDNNSIFFEYTAVINDAEWYAITYREGVTPRMLQPKTILITQQFTIWGMLVNFTAYSKGNNMQLYFVDTRTGDSHPIQTNKINGKLNSKTNDNSTVYQVSFDARIGDNISIYVSRGSGEFNIKKSTYLESFIINDTLTNKNILFSGSGFQSITGYISGVLDLTTSYSGFVIIIFIVILLIALAYSSKLLRKRLISNIDRKIEGNTAAPNNTLSINSGSTIDIDSRNSPERLNVNKTEKILNLNNSSDNIIKNKNIGDVLPRNIDSENVSENIGAVDANPNTNTTINQLREAIKDIERNRYNIKENTESTFSLSSPSKDIQVIHGNSINDINENRRLYMPEDMPIEVYDELLRDIMQNSKSGSSNRLINRSSNRLGQGFNNVPANMMQISKQESKQTIKQRFENLEQHMTKKVITKKVKAGVNRELRKKDQLRHKEKKQVQTKALKRRNVRNM